jgi:hypothetical protein
MLKGTKRAIWAVAASMLSLTGASTVESSVHAEDEDACTPLHGTYDLTFTTTNCTSPTGLCATGTVTGAGLLNGTASWIELDQAPSAGMPATEPGTVVSYSGTVTFTAKGGTLTVRDLGVVAGNQSVFTELERPVGGTGIFASTSSVFYISGQLLNGETEFLGHLSGSLCTTHP